MAEDPHGGKVVALERERLRRRRERQLTDHGNQGYSIVVEVPETLQEIPPTPENRE